jgi:membrane fusion protein, multidrug efflux system
MILNYFKMDNMYKLTAVAALIVFAVACGGGNATEPANDKKAQLDKLRQQQAQINEQVRSLEQELAKTDTLVANKLNAKLVVITPIATKNFTHYIELQGKIDAENIAYVTPRGQGGQVKAVYVKQGDNVRKGQLLLKLDDVVASQQLQQAKIQLSLAEDLYNRRKNLWDKQIGTEVELIQARTNVENLKKTVSLAEEQVSMSNVYAQISGVADMVNIKPGEFFSPASASQLGIRIVNTNNLKVTVNVPENYSGQVQQGSAVQISLPDINKTITSRVSVKGRTIDPSSRTFYIEAKISAAKDFRPNQLALVKIQDYSVPNAITIPMNTLQNDEKGKYVMVAANENGRLVAKKRQIEVGQLYGNDLEVKSGLQANDSLITEGFQGLYDGQPLTTGENS